MTLRLSIDRLVAHEVARLVRQNQPAAVSRVSEVILHVARLADRILVDPAFRSRSRPFQDRFRSLQSENPAVASQGIVIGGSMAKDIRILNNTINDVLQGVHIGLSHSGTRRPDMAGTVRIADNTVNVLLPPFALDEHYGIFVGNCDSLVVEDNYVAIQRYSKSQNLYIEGVRVDGILGRLAILRQNHLVSASTGIYFNARTNVGKLNYQWLIEDNMAPQACKAVDVAGRSLPGCTSTQT